MKKVSIIIPVYNCPYVDQAIESALIKVYPPLLHLYIGEDLYEMCSLRFRVSTDH